MAHPDASIHERPAELLQKLIRFDTTNPPGNERECLGYLDGLLAGAGLETRMVAKDEERPNLLARLRGRGEAPPLLLQAHVDVVTTAGQDWRHPPFEGRIEDGFVWGRGALDMKGAVTMMVAAVLRAHADGLELPGDVLVCLMSDEEAGSDLGARFLVEEHAELFDGVRHAIGEFGGFPIDFAGRRIYPIMVAEKLNCQLRLTARGPGGHGSLPLRGGAMARAACAIDRLDGKRLPVHVTPVVRTMIGEMAAAAPRAMRPLFEALVRPPLTDRVLGLLGERGQAIDPILHNTVNATIVRGGSELNVIPSEVTIDLDGRLLPGFTPDTLVDEVRAVVGDDLEIEVLRSDPVAPEPDLSAFSIFADILRESDPGGHPIPNVLPAVTDGRFFARLGIQTYGFTPMRLPQEMSFMKLVHGADERVPVEAIEFGTRAIRTALERYRPSDTAASGS